MSPTSPIRRNTRRTQRDELVRMMIGVHFGRTKMGILPFVHSSCTSESQVKGVLDFPSVFVWFVASSPGTRTAVEHGTTPAENGEEAPGIGLGPPEGRGVWTAGCTLHFLHFPSQKRP